MLLLAYSRGLISSRKIEQACRENVVFIALAELRKKKEKIETKVAQLLEEQVQADQGQDYLPGPRSSSTSRQQQVEKLQKKAELIDKWLAEHQPKQGTAGRENQSNITDNDSAKMMTSHGAVQRYNSQALIDGKHQVIVHGEAFGDGQDHGHVPPMLTGAKPGP